MICVSKGEGDHDIPFESVPSEMSYLVGLLAALIIINKDRFERFPEESRAWFYTILGPQKGEDAFHIYWHFLRRHKEKNFTIQDAWVDVEP